MTDDPLDLGVRPPMGPTAAALRPYALELAVLEATARTVPRIRHGDVEIDPPQADAARLLADTIRRLAVIIVDGEIGETDPELVTSCLASIYLVAASSMPPTDPRAQICRHLAQDLRR